MVDLSIPLAEESERSAGLFRRVGNFFALIGAAIRAAQAVEAHRPPHPRDMAILGIDAELPRAW